MKKLRANEQEGGALLLGRTPEPALSELEDGPPGTLALLVRITTRLQRFMDTPVPTTASASTP